MAFPTFTQGKVSVQGYSKTRQTAVIRNRFENGDVLARERFPNRRYVWTVAYEALSDADKTSLISWWDGLDGGAQTDTWTDPEDSQTYTVRPVGDLHFRPWGGLMDHWSVRLTLEEA